MKSFVAVVFVAVASLVSSRPFVMDKNNEALHPARAVGNGDWYHPPHHHPNGTSPWGGKPYQHQDKSKRNWYPHPHHPHHNGSYPHHGGPGHY